MDTAFPVSDDLWRRIEARHDMLDRLNDLQAKIDAEKASAAGEWGGVTRAGIGIGSILDILSEVITIVKAVISGHGSSTPPAPPAA